MIKFFRNIRQKLLLEGKITNYLKYAIGEILLVVIGILIAININDLNNRQTKIADEKKLIASLIQELSNHEMKLKEHIGEILLVVFGKISPVRDLIRVEEQTISRYLSVPLGTGYYGKSSIGKNHIAYLRHANSIYKFFFFLYSVLTGHSLPYGFIKLSNLKLL
jgi:hypothetical protein